MVSALIAVPAHSTPSRCAASGHGLQHRRGDEHAADVLCGDDRFHLVEKMLYVLLCDVQLAGGHQLLDPARIEVHREEHPAALAGHVPHRAAYDMRPGGADVQPVAA
jgi:hypothetical protein